MAKDKPLCSRVFGEPPRHCLLDRPYLNLKFSTRFSLDEGVWNSDSESHLISNPVLLSFALAMSRTPFDDWSWFIASTTMVNIDTIVLQKRFQQTKFAKFLNLIRWVHLLGWSMSLRFVAVHVEVPLAKERRLDSHWKDHSTIGHQ